MTQQTSSKSRVWPLYLLGFSLMAFGFYFAFFQSDAPASAPTKKIDGFGSEKDRVPSNLERGDAVLLALASAPRKSKVWLEQSQASKDGGAVDTQILFTMVDSPIEGLKFERTYPEVEIISQSVTGPMGSEIPSHVAELLKTVKHEIEYQENGRVQSYALVSSQSGQLGPLLGMIKDAMQMLSPQFPREPVNVDEPWSYRAPYELSSEDNSVTAQGDYQVSNTYRGVLVEGDRRLAVIEQNISGKGSGKVADAGKPVTFATTGVGHAVFYFDMKVRQVVRAGLVFEQVTSIGDSAGIQSTTTLTLEPAP